MHDQIQIQGAPFKETMGRHSMVMDVAQPVNFPLGSVNRWGWLRIWGDNTRYLVAEINGQTYQVIQSRQSVQAEKELGTIAKRVAKTTRVRVPAGKAAYRIIWEQPCIKEYLVFKAVDNSALMYVGWASDNTLYILCDHEWKLTRNGSVEEEITLRKADGWDLIGRRAGK